MKIFGLIYAHRIKNGEKGVAVIGVLMGMCHFEELYWPTASLFDGTK